MDDYIKVINNMIIFLFIFSWIQDFIQFNFMKRLGARHFNLWQKELKSRVKLKDLCCRVNLEYFFKNEKIDAFCIEFESNVS